ncbi:MAG TPA: membrane dipeptidase [Pyrinomonadaceae bacterium]|nr:membrane dipeptidase [Pyrinomonadaceae bacterium]
MITRRQFAKSLGSAVVLSTLKPELVWPSGPPQVSAKAAELYRSSFVLDCNTLASIGFQLTGDEQEVKLKAVRDSGITVLKSTLGGPNGTFEQTRADIAAADELIEKKPDLFLKVRSPGDLQRAQQQRKVGVIFSFEAATMLEDKIERIEQFRNLGVRIMQLTYNRRSPFAVGCLDGDEQGLTELGREAVAKMNTLGVALDLSHANTRTIAEGIATSKKPPIVSHSGCRSVHMHPRNLEDRVMKALATKGGIMGIYMLPYLTPSPKQPTLDDYMRHMEHALKICGEDHVGIGTDVPFRRITENDLEGLRKQLEQRKAAGVSAPGEDRPPYIPDLNTPRKIEIVVDALLKRGYTSRIVEKVLGANFKRVFSEIWTA